MKLNEAINVQITPNEDADFLEESISSKLKGFFAATGGAVLAMGVTGYKVGAGFYASGLGSGAALGTGAQAAIMKVIGGLSLIQLSGSIVMLQLLGIGVGGAAAGYAAYRLFKYSASSKKLGKELARAIETRDNLIAEYVAMPDKSSKNAQNILKQIDVSTAQQRSISIKLMKVIDKDYKNGEIDESVYGELQEQLKLAADARLTNLGK